MNQFIMQEEKLSPEQDAMELSFLGGKKKYDEYCLKIKKYLDDHPDENKNQIIDGVLQSNPDLLRNKIEKALNRAIREKTIEYNFEKPSKDGLKRTNSMSSEASRAKLIAQLHAAAQNDYNKRNDPRSKLIIDLNQKRKNNDDYTR